MKYKTIDSFVRLLTILSIFILVSLCSYYQSPLYISSHTWKSISENNPEDYLSFDDDTYRIKWPNIYSGNNKMGVLIFCSGNKLWMCGIQGNIYSYTIM